MEPQYGLDFEDCEEIDIQPELEIDFKYAAVNVVDGILIANSDDDEQVKMLFYHYKVGESSNKGNNIQCQAVSEFRVSRTQFLEIAQRFEEKAKELIKYQMKLEDFMFA